jgi:hypothetical protein
MSTPIIEGQLKDRDPRRRRYVLLVEDPGGPGTEESRLRLLLKRIRPWRARQVRDAPPAAGGKMA